MVSVHVALSMVNEAVFTDVWVINRSVVLYQDTFDNGLLKISRVIVIMSLSFTSCNGLFSMTGGSKYKRNLT